MSPVEAFIFISVLIVIVYSVGLWAGRNLEREIEADKIKQALKDKELNKRRR